MRPLAFAAALTLATPGAFAQDEDGITVAFALNLAEGSVTRGALASLEPIRAFVREQPGLIDEQLLRGEVGSSEDYIHVTRWERLEDWEAMFTDQAFLDLLTATDPEFEPTTAEVYTPVP